jgi:DnaJ-domain-containing protein 1
MGQDVWEMGPAMQHGRDFLRWFDDLSLITQSIVLFGVFMLLRGLLLWMKSRRQRREAATERAGWQQEKWNREQQERQQQETQEQNEKQRAHERTQKRRRKQYARDGNDGDPWGRHNQRDPHREGDQGDGAQGHTRQTNDEQPRPWWQVLGIPEGSTLDEVKVAYYTKVKQYHPDKVMGLGEEFQKLADDKTKEINEAFESAKRALR